MKQKQKDNEQQREETRVKNERRSNDTQENES